MARNKKGGSTAPARTKKLMALILMCGAMLIFSLVTQQSERNRLSLITSVNLLTTGETSTTTTDNTDADAAGKPFTASTTTTTTATTTTTTNNNIPPKLEFVHITKTGGSAIEKAAASQAGIAWGACHYNNGLFKESGCPPPPDLEHHIKMSANHPFSSGGLSRWHVPLQYLEPYPFAETTKTFAVVRNPYDRAISLYYCPWAGYKGFNADNIATFNQWIQQQVRKQEGILLTPQSLYVWDKDKKMVDHVIHYEALSDEFNQLMQDYQLNISLPQEKHNAGKSRQKRLTRDDLTRDTIALINEVYREDFDNFGYEQL